MPHLDGGELQDMLPVGVESILLPEEVRSHVEDLKLPPGYALIGGAARSIAAKIFTGNELPVRDIDVAAFDECHPDLSLAEGVSERLMPDDYAFNHGVQSVSLRDYFKSRDLTMNEVAVIDGQLLVTDQARYDLEHSIIRPTDYEHNPEQDTHLSPRLAIKIVLLQAVLERATGEPSLVEGVDLRGYRCDLTDSDTEERMEWVRPFYVALGFQKALEYDRYMASTFLDKLQEYNMIRAGSLNYQDEVDGRLSLFGEEIAMASDFEFRGEAALRLDRIHQSAAYSLGDLLHFVGGEEYDEYVRYHELAQRYGGKGRKYTDESKY